MKQYLLLTTLCFSLILTSLFTLPAHADNQDISKIIESSIIQKLGPNFDLNHWEVVNVEKVDSGAAIVEKSTLKIICFVKEALYKPAGKNKKKEYTIRVSKAAGDSVELQGLVITMNIQGVATQPKPQVVLTSTGLEFGMPLNRFPKNVVVARDMQNTQQPDTASEQPKNENPAPEQATAAKTELHKLFAVYNKTGEIWGTDMSPNYKGSPITLRDLVMVDDQTVTGKLHHPYQLLANDFILVEDHGQFRLQIKVAKPNNKGVRSAHLLCVVEEDELVARSGPHFALSAEKNSLIQKGFEKNLEPWKFAGDISDYFNFQGKLLRVDTLEEASSSWIQSVTGSAIRVRNLPSRFVSSNLAYVLTTSPFGTYPVHTVKTAEPKGRVPLKPISNSKNPTWVSYNLGEYVTLRDGDLWHGKLDWQGNSTKQEKNITNIGILNNLAPITWYGKDFYFFNQTSREKPILRVDVYTGKFDELAPVEAMQRYSNGSPDGRFVFFSDGRTKIIDSKIVSLIHVYDCKKRQSFTMDATIDERSYTGSMKREPRSMQIKPRTWLSNSLFITGIGWYDLEKRTRHLFIEAQGVIRDRPEHHYRTITHNLLPSSQFVDITVTSYLNKKQVHRRYRLDRLTNSTVELPMEFDREMNYNGNITWIDKNRYVFSKSTGGLSDIGTWLYDLRTKEYRKLTSFYQNGRSSAENYSTGSNQDILWHTPIYNSNPHLIFPDKDRIVFAIMKGNSPFLLSVPLNEGDIIEIPIIKNGVGGMTRIIPVTIELPQKIHSQTITPVSPNLSKPDRAAQTGNENTNQIVDSDKPISNGASETQIKEAESVYEWCTGNMALANNTDCKCLADKFLDMRSNDYPDMEKTSLVMKITQTGCYNIIRTTRLEYETCMKRSGFSYNGIPPEKYCECYAEQWSKQLKAFKGIMDANIKSRMRLKARSHCQRASSYAD